MTSLVQTMKGATFPGNKEAKLGTFTVLEPSYGQVLLKMSALGICGSDLLRGWTQNF